MLKKSSEHIIRDRLNFSLRTVGDMALKRRAKRIVEALEPRQGDKILEVGCGNGYYLSLLNRLGLKISLTGIDNDKAALFDAQRFIGDERISLFLADAAKLPFKDSSFNKIICSEVIEHVKDDKKVLQEIHRVLKSGGIMVLSTCDINYPFFWDPINWLLQHVFKTHIKRGFWSGIWNQHLRMYEKKEVEKLVKEVNFKISTSESLTGWCLPFNHYIINFVARLIARYIYLNKLPEQFAEGLIKFKNEKQSLPVKSLFWLVNTFDKLNDLFPQKNGVSIFIKARK
ncbi:class I SAM-dependent methyltransferase [Candidatus Daviesbacteria bacterium]|nr:class I SAM-dependent methyltransferase [Candidatus Daviesbacteria bacterium]